MTNKKTLEDALAEMEAKKSQLADHRLKHAVEIETDNRKVTAFNKRLDALSQSERRQVLDAAGLKHISAAPRPIDPIRASRSIPPQMPPDLVAMAQTKAAQSPMQEPQAMTPSPAPVVNPKRNKNKPSIETVALDYMRAEFKHGQFQSAAKFHKHLMKTAGLDKSPFEVGSRTNAGKLFCTDASSFFDAGTLGKLWPKIRAE